ncbi:NADPH-dependent FMN reductase [Pseudomonas aeruginosa]|uniref:NADPH-dependent FMN reductase n=1 Tax=Pseudomonas aeruginosa TaxID=287 RepID=UPI0034D31128
MVYIIGVAGSLRRMPYNMGLLKAAVELMPKEVTFEIKKINAIPLFNSDNEEVHGPPAAVIELKEAIMAADGVILATPEYNNGIPGVFKNAIDWASRPVADIPKVFGGRPFAVMGASPGGFGTLLSQDAWLSVLRMLGTEPWFGGRLLVSHAGQLFDEKGDLIDEGMRERLREYIYGFVSFVKEHNRL